ncbi:hypothetical protein ACLMJK_007091 [Lecanora helva]
MIYNNMGVTIGPHGMIGLRYDPGFVVLSYLVSFAGCWTSLELLQMRTGARGYYNWYLLIAAASSMGPVAIWSMHYIGNRAIIMDKGQPQAQIQYSPGFTAASFFVPTFVVGFAFYLFSITEKVNIFGTLLGGFFTGAAVCGMHFMGQGGIANYIPSYTMVHVFGSAVTAIIATTISLSAFFYFRSVWTNSWWKRAMCASILACAVSSMHWIATVGTTYHLKPDHPYTVVGLSRKATVIVVMILAMACCGTLITIAAFGQRSRQRSADRAQQVVLACATFDSEGRLMVTPEGLLPSRKITESYIERSFEDVFDIDHPVFCWIYRASRCWGSVTNLIPGIRSHLRYTLPKEPSSSFLSSLSPKSSSGPRSSNSSGSIDDYSQLFKEFFFAAAKDLADMIQEPMEDLGVLSGTIMSTGTLSRTARLRLHGLRLRNNSLDSAERGESPPLSAFGRGQLLFVVRQANRVQSSRLQSIGHRFAAIPNVVDTLARSMQVTREELLPQLEAMRSSVLDEHMLEPGVYIASFALRPVFHRGFDVVVRKDASNVLPTSFLQKSPLEPWQIEFLTRMDNLTFTTCCDLLQEKRMVINDYEDEFASEVLEGFLRLAQIIDSSYLSEARLVARPLAAPCSPHKHDGVFQHAYLITFRNIVDAHQTSSINSAFQFEPLRFFLCQQHAYENSPDNNVFARKVHREFGALAKHAAGFQHRPSTAAPQSSEHRSSSETLNNAGDLSPTQPKKKCWPSLINLKGFEARHDNSSEKNIILVQPYGGIHVSEEVAVDISDSRVCETDSGIEMQDFGTASEIGVGDTEPDSFADKLVAITIEDRKKQRNGGN